MHETALVKTFKEHWEIKHNWQLIFPFLGILAIIYSSIKLARVFLEDVHISLTALATLLLSVILLKFFLFLFKKLQPKWKPKYKWEMITIFIVFAVTGTSSVYVSRLLMPIIGITKETLNPILYWTLYSIFGLVFYQILLVSIGWLFGQFDFFWTFEKKILSKLGLKRFFKE